MSKSIKHGLYGRFANFIVYAVTGRSGVGVTVFVYSVVAVLLLAYVSVQIYAGVLRQEVAALEQRRLDSRDALNKLYSRYVSLSSRACISEYCRNKLGMVDVGDGNLEIVAVDGRLKTPDSVAITGKPEAVLSAQRYTFRRSDRDLGQ